MIPKEKAKELYFKMHSQEQIVSKEAKQCALIAVDEIINASPIEPMTFLNGMRSTIPYWEEVKKEIEKL
jgi:hypothetical protein